VCSVSNGTPAATARSIITGACSGLVTNQTSSGTAALAHRSGRRSTTWAGTRSIDARAEHAGRRSPKAVQEMLTARAGIPTRCATTCAAGGLADGAAKQRRRDHQEEHSRSRESAFAKHGRDHPVARCELAEPCDATPTASWWRSMAISTSSRIGSLTAAGNHRCSRPRAGVAPLTVSSEPPSHSRTTAFLCAV
jgi:hypothetical protein